MMNDVKNFVTFETVYDTWKPNVVGNLEYRNFYPSRSTLLPSGVTAITGGYQNDEVLDLFQTFDSKFKFTKMPSMIYKRQGHGQVYADGSLFVLGGWNYYQNSLNQCEKFDFTKQTWSPISTIPYAKHSLGCCSFQATFIYVFGGYDGEFLNIIDRYSINENKWETLKIKLPLPVSSC